MSDILYDSNPSMIRMYPFLTVLSVILIPVGIGILALLWMYLLTKMDKLTITKDELVWAHGLINKDYTEIALTSVRSVRVSQTLLQRILNAGNVSVYTAGDEPELVIKGLPNPDKIRDLINGKSLGDA